MTQRFKPGDRVVVRNEHPAGHIRTPTYLRGRKGVILRDFGAWPNPETLAYGRDGQPAQVNHWVQFAMDEVWAGVGDYARRDTVVAEIYEHWLEPAAGPAGRKRS